MFRLFPRRGALLGLAALVTGGAAHAAVNPIRLNSVGFLPDRAKRATIASPCTEFALVREPSNRAVFHGVISGPVTNRDTGEQVYIADFSTFTRQGTYRLEVPGVGRSPEFRIAADVYDDAFRTVTRAMYLWRCGIAVSGERNGVKYAHGACHLDDAYLDFVGGGHVRKDGTRGWHDAGDFNKYVVNAGVTVGAMLLAWEQFPFLAKVSLDLPESGNGIPDYLNEVRWELDWLLTTQAPDGSVYHKVSEKSFGPARPPEQDTSERYFTPWSSAATADFVAMMAMAARDYAPYDKSFAARCLEAARKSYAFLEAHPGNHPADLTGFSTGGYQTDDPDDRLWATAELWDATGDAAALKQLEAGIRAFQPKVDRDFGWGNVKDLAMFRYLLSKRTGRDPALVGEVTAALTETADGIVKTRDAHGYGRPYGETYFWGCNGAVATQVALLQMANRLQPKAQYVDTALDAIGHLLGRNYYGRSFVTGVGFEPPQHAHDRRSMGTPGAPSWPGYLVGGGWPKATDWQDDIRSYQTNEIAINWNGPLIYALAGFIADPRPGSVLFSTKGAGK